LKNGIEKRRSSTYQISWVEKFLQQSISLANEKLMVDSLVLVVWLIPTLDTSPIYLLTTFPALSFCTQLE